MKQPYDGPHHDGKASGGVDPSAAGRVPGEADVSLLEQLAEFSQSAGEYGSAMEYYEQLLAIAEKARRSSDLFSQILFKMAVCQSQTGDYARGLDLLDSALGQLSPDAPTDMFCSIQNERASILTNLGRYDEAEECVREVTRRILDPRETVELARAQKCQGVLAMRRGDSETAQRSFEVALSGYRLVDDREGLANCRHNLAILEKSRGNLERAAQHQRAALRHYEDIGNTTLVGGALNNLGLIEFKLGRWEGACGSWERASRLMEGVGHKWGVAHVSLNLGNYHRHLRDWDEAEKHYLRAQGIIEELGEARELVLVSEFRGDLAFASENYDDARRLYTAALERGTALAPQGDLVLEARRRLADLESRLGRTTEARQHLAAGMELVDRLDDRFERGVLLRVQARIEGRDGEIAVAADTYRRALREHADCQTPFELAVTRLEYASFCIENILELEEAALQLEQARRTFEEVGARYEAGHAYLMAAKLEMVCDHPTGDARHHLEAAIDLLERVGSEDDRETLRAVHRDIDRLLAETSASERNDLAALNEAVARIRIADDAAGQVREIEDALEARMNADRVGLFTMSTASGRLALAGGSSLGSADAARAVRIIARLRGEAELTSKPLVSTSPARDPRFAGSDGGIVEGVGSVAFMPLFTDGQLVGGLYTEVRAEVGYFHQPELDFLVAFAPTALMAVQEMRLEAAREENLRLRRRIAGRGGFEGIITQSRRMLEIIDLVERLRDSRATILLQGETGTGKELLARAAHAVSTRSAKPLVTVNCAALSRDVLESELFGHLKGSFTDAKADKIGLFEEADGSAIFLDEIDKTTPAFQERLLRVVDQGEIKPVGSAEARRVDVRILCATNRPLKHLVEEGLFLKDLYYRLRVISIDLPPLRERKEDVPLLVDHFLHHFTRSLSREIRGFSHEAMNALVAHSWPGNVRDLRHEVERAVAMAQGGSRIDAKDLSPELQEAAPPNPGLRPNQSLQHYVEEIERELVTRALRKTEGNRSRAAKLLGISRRGLLNKIARYSIDA
jgi:DNA-binding NtrC family response regulator/tetratricopeptide (TPR) repeat protein